MSLFIPRRRFDSRQPELMDRPDAPAELLRGELRNLRLINARMGSLTLVRDAVLSLIAPIDPNRPIEILDLATGSADQSVSLVEALRRAGRLVSITAVDKNAIVLDAARRFARHVPEIRFERRDILALPYADRSFDIAICSFALHHFSRTDAVTILREMDRLSRAGFVVHDLSRGYAAAVATWLYTHATTTNIMTRRDGTTSVMNAFVKSELRQMVVEAGIADAAVWNAGFFRLMAVCSTRRRPASPPRRPRRPGQHSRCPQRRTLRHAHAFGDPGVDPCHRDGSDLDDGRPGDATTRCHGGDSRARH